MTFAAASQVALQQFIRNPDWKGLEDTSGAPSSTTAGVPLDGVPVCLLDVQLREDLRYRRGRVTVDDVQDSTAYSVDIEGTSASITSDGSATEEEIVNSLAEAINALRTRVHARTVDQSGDGNKDEVIIESNWSCFHVNSVQNTNDYFVTINGTKITFSSDASATEVEIISGMEAAIDQSSVPADAVSEDTTGDGNVDTVFVVPVEADTLEWGAIEPNLTLDATGAEPDNPHYAITSGDEDLLSLDADATKGKAIFFATYKEGENPDTKPGGWRIVEKIESVDYRGLEQDDAYQLCGPYDRGYIQFITNSGTIRSASIGLASTEG